MGVSVIIASHNCELYIEECLASLFNQDYKGELEIVVCDDCSTDGTRSILERYEKEGRIVLIKNQENLGPALTRNKCIERATQEFIVIQDADDYSHPNRLTLLVNSLVNNPTVGFVSSGIRCFYEDGSTFDLIPKKEFPTKKDFLMSLPFPHAATMFRSQILKDVGGYDNFRRAEDYYLFMKVYAQGGIGMNLSEVLYYYRCFKNKKVKNLYSVRINEAKIRFKGFKLLGFGIIGIPYVIKPLVLGLFPRNIQLYIRNIYNKPRKTTL